MKTPIQELIEKYNEHLKYDSDLDSISGREILKVILVDLISSQAKEKECPDIYDEYKYQVSAYVHLYNENNSDNPISEAIIVSVAKDKVAFNIAFL